MIRLSGVGDIPRVGISPVVGYPPWDIPCRVVLQARCFFQTSPREARRGEFPREVMENNQE